MILTEHQVERLVSAIESIAQSFDKIQSHFTSPEMWEALDWLGSLKWLCWSIESIADAVQDRALPTKWLEE